LFVRQPYYGNGNGTKPATDDAASVGKGNRRKESQTSRHVGWPRRNKNSSGSAKTGYKWPYGGPS
jgi:hypothetical protein